MDQPVPRVHVAKAASSYDAPLRSSFMLAVDKFVVHSFLRQRSTLAKNFKSMVTELFKSKTDKTMPIERRRNLQLTYY